MRFTVHEDIKLTPLPLSKTEYDILLRHKRDEELSLTRIAWAWGEEETTIQSWLDLYSTKMAAREEFERVMEARGGIALERNPFLSTTPKMLQDAIDAYNVQLIECDVTATIWTAEAYTCCLLAQKLYLQWREMLMAHDAWDSEEDD